MQNKNLGEMIMGVEEQKKDLLRAVKKDDFACMMRLLKDNDIAGLVKGEFGQELLEASLSEVKCNRFKCTVYLINHDIDPTRLTDVSLAFGISPLHSIAITMRDTTHLTDKEQCEILNAIILFEIRHGRSPMMTLKMRMVSESTPYEILKLSQKNYYTQTKQTYLEKFTRDDTPSMSLRLNNHAKSSTLSYLAHYLFSFMSGSNSEKENQSANEIEMEKKTIKCE